MYKFSPLSQRKYQEVYLFLRNYSKTIYAILPVHQVVRRKMCRSRTPTEEHIVTFYNLRLVHDSHIVAL